MSMFEHPAVVIYLNTKNQSKFHGNSTKQNPSEQLLSEPQTKHFLKKERED